MAETSPRTIIFDNKKITLQEDFDKSILEGISWVLKRPMTHDEVAKHLKNKHPYTITIIYEPLKSEYRQKKEYVTYSRYPKEPLYKEELFKMFYEEFSDQFTYAGRPYWANEKANEVYGQWLDKYRPILEKEGKDRDIDEYILKKELEPRYKDRILKKYKGHKKLFRKRYGIDIERKYHISEPISTIAGRGNPFDNIFVWEENGKKVATRGASGSSGSRETNSRFAFGLLKLNQTQPVPSYLFLYSEENILLLIKKFDNICLPFFDIGSNYHLPKEEEEELTQGVGFLNWHFLGDDYSGVIKTIDLIAR